MATKIIGTDVMSLHVNDIDRARKFYQNAMGFKELMFDEESAWAMYEIPNSPPLGVHQFDHGCEEAGGRPPGTVTGLILAVEDCDAAVAEMESNGATVTDPPYDSPWGTRAATVADPDGNEFIISTRAEM